MSENELNNQNTELVFSQREKLLMDVMAKRALTEAEAKMISTRDMAYNTRKFREKILFMLPSIIYSLTQLILALVGYFSG